MAQDLYAVLGVARDADEDAVKKAFRKLAMKYHPDKSPGKANEQRFKDINTAYEVLGDKKKRALYDEFGEQSLAQGFDADRARFMKQQSRGGGRGGAAGFDVQDMFGGAGGVGGADFSDILGDLFNRGRPAPGGRPGARRTIRGSDVEAEVTIDFVGAVKGTTLELSREGASPATVRIPPGANEGSRLRIAGQGSPSIAGGPPGDLLLTIHVTPHPFFKREGDDLHLDLPVTFGEAYRGDRVRVPTPDGEVTMKVPARTQSGQVSRLRGKGVARKNKEPGDLYVRFIVHVPTEDDPELERVAELLHERTPDPRRGLKF